MAAVQCGNGQKVHDSQHDREQRQDAQESVPVPDLREHLPYGDETANGLVGAGRRPHQHSEILHVTAYGLPGETQASRDRLQEGILTPFDLRHHKVHAHQPEAVHLHRDGECVGATEYLRIHSPATASGKHGAGILDECNFLTIKGQHPVAPKQSANSVGPVGAHRIDDERHRQVEHHRAVQHVRHIGVVDIEVQGVGAAEDTGVAHVAPCQFRLQHAEVLRLVAVEVYDMVAKPETHLLRQLVGGDPGVPVADERLPPYAGDEAVNQYCKDEVVEHSACHHQQPLPGRFGAEFPWLRLPFQLFQVHGLIYHAGYLAIASERNPADSELGLAPVPFDQGLAEEEVKAFNPDTEYPGPYEVTELVRYDEQREGQDDLQCLN